MKTLQSYIASSSQTSMYNMHRSGSNRDQRELRHILRSHCAECVPLRCMTKIHTLASVLYLLKRSVEVIILYLAISKY